MVDAPLPSDSDSTIYGCRLIWVLSTYSERDPILPNPSATRMSKPKHSGSASVESGLDVSTIRTTLNFYLEPSKGGHSSYSVGTAGYYRRKFDTQPVDVHDLRGQLEDFTLHTHGFQFCRHTSAQTTFTDDAQMKKMVYAEVEQLLREVYERSFCARPRLSLIISGPERRKSTYSAI